MDFLANNPEKCEYFNTTYHLSVKAISFSEMAAKAPLIATPPQLHVDMHQAINPTRTTQRITFFREVPFATFEPAYLRAIGNNHRVSDSVYKSHAGYKVS